MNLNQKLFKFLDIFGYIFLLLNIVTIPLFLDKSLVNFYIIPKQYAFICLLLINVVLFAAKMILSKSLSFRKSVMDIPILGLLVVTLFSALFSVNKLDSFLGRTEYFVFSYIFLIFLVIFYFLITNFINSKNRWVAMFDTFIYTGGFLILLFILRSIFRLDILGQIFPGVLNTIDNLNAPFGIITVLILILSTGALLKKTENIGKSFVYFFITIISFVSLVLLSFKLLWWIALAGIILLLLVGVSFIKEVRLGWVSALFAILILVITFIFFGTPRYMQTALPMEISLGAKSSWEITSKTIFSNAKNFVLGNGLGTFNVVFSQFRNISFNNDALAWSLRFNHPHSTFIALIAEAGILVTLIFLFITLYTVGHLFNILFKKTKYSTRTELSYDQSGLKIDMFVVAIAWLVLTGSMAVLFFGTVLWWTWFLLFGLVVTGLYFFNAEILKLKHLEIEDTPQYSLTFSFVMIVILAGLIMIGIWGSRLYLAEKSYAKAIKSQEISEAENYLRTALYQRVNSDLYHAALAQVYLMQATKLVNEEVDDLQLISAYVAEAVNEARIATEISPKSVAIWENLAVMYENAALLVPEAREWAIKSWEKAKELEPTNPLLSWNLANNYLVSNEVEEAIKHYKNAYELKANYIDPYISLANLYEQQEKIDEAVDIYKIAMQSGGSSNPFVLYDFGRILYNRNQENDRSDTELLWLNAVGLAPDYSNALYGLGLLYEAQGDKAKALQYFYAVKDLNPDIKEISEKIKTLVGSTKTPEVVSGETIEPLLDEKPEIFEEVES